MTGAVYARTPNLGLGLLEFNFPNWGDDENQNMKVIDAGFGMTGISIKGAWQNGALYNAGDLVVDTDQNTIWRCQVSHTSALTGTFAADRTAHPTYWVDASQSLHARGQWATGVTYYTNDVVYENANKYSWALATRQFVSGSSYSGDVASGAFVIITDTTQAVTDATAAKNAAQSSATAAASSASAASGSQTAAATSATNAANSASAAGTSATNAANSASAASTSATNAANSATSAATSAQNALNIYNSMYPDAPSDGVTYGRKNGAWATTVSTDSPVFTGDPRAVTQPNTDNDTSIATTAFVHSVRLDQMAQPFASIGMNGQLITSLATPVSATDAATKAYVDAHAGGGGAGTTISDTPPASPTQGQTWWESDSGNFYISYNDGNSSQWVQINTQPASDGFTRPTVDGNYVWNSKSDNSGSSIASLNNAGAMTLSGVLTATGATLSGALTGTTASFSGALTMAYMLTVKAPDASTNAHLAFANEVGTPQFYNFWNRAANTLNWQYQGSTTLMTLDSAGLLTTTANVQANGGYFVGPGASAVLYAPAAGSVVVLQAGGQQAYVRQSDGWFIAPALYSSTVVHSYGGYSGTGAAAAATMSQGWIRTSGNVPSIWSHHTFYNTNGAVGQITTTNSTTAYATSSDERLKDFTGLLSGEDAAAIIRADPTRRFTWKVDGTAAVGWGAQTSYALSEDLASPPPDELRNTQPGDEDFTPWGMDQGKRTPYLWAALAWALDRIDSLETRIAALEAARGV